MTYSVPNQATKVAKISLLCRWLIFHSGCGHVWRCRLVRHRSLARGTGQYGRSVYGSSSLQPTQDYDLSAVFMRNWDTKDELGADGQCEWEKDWHDVQQVCKLLDIPCKMARACTSITRPYCSRVSTGRPLTRVLAARLRACAPCLGARHDAQPGRRLQQGDQV